MIDMTGWKMCEHGVSNSKWTVIEYIGKSKWKCVCECGNIRNVDGVSLRSGNSKSCGKCGTKKNRTIDMTGWKMWEHGVSNSKIIVLKQAPSNGGHALWECKCSCGNPTTFIVDGSNLRKGHTISCGCMRKGNNHKDYCNQTINNIFIGEVVGKNKQGSYLYDCICFCGNHFISDATRIINGHKQSCGCLKSKGEAKIKNILDNLNIKYKSEYPIEICGPNNCNRRIDFAVFVEETIKCFIEYQGEQHYNVNNVWHRPAADEEKRLYCKEKHIPLIEIPYTDYKALDEKYLLTKLEENCIEVIENKNTVL